eukprot:scaffold58873_cov34-Phaeocystis_antarctica.AAC.1
MVSACANGASEVPGSSRLASWGTPVRTERAQAAWWPPWRGPQSDQRAPRSRGNESRRSRAEPSLA